MAYFTGQMFCQAGSFFESIGSEIAHLVAQFAALVLLFEIVVLVCSLIFEIIDAITHGCLFVVNGLGLGFGGSLSGLLANAFCGLGFGLGGLCASLKIVSVFHNDSFVFR